MKEAINDPSTYELGVYRLQRTLVVVSLLTLVTHYTTCAQPTSAGANPCGVAGAYELDRKAEHARIVAYTDSTVAALGDRPAEGGDAMAQIRWEAEREALQEVRERAVEGQVIPRMTAKLDPDGTFTHIRYSLEGGDRIDVQNGHWEIDDACQTLVIDVNDHQTMGKVVDGRLILDIDPPPGMGSLTVEFVKIE